VAEFFVIDDLAPTAVLDAPELVTPGSPVPLSGVRSTDVPGKIANYTWTLPGGQEIETKDPTFNASSAGLSNGLHTFSLTVTDDSGNESNPVARVVEIGPDNRKPTAVLEGPDVVGIGDPIALSGARSTDVGGRVIRYRWTVAGQTIETADPAFNAEPGFNVPALPVGRHVISLAVRDDSGNDSNPIQHEVIVRDDQAPSAILDAPASVTAGAVIPLSGARSPDIGGRVVRYIWTVAGRAQVETADPTFNAPGLPAGRHSVSLVVVDDSGNQSNADTKFVDAIAPSAPPQFPTGKRLTTFGSTTLIAPIGRANSQIDLGDGTVLAGRIFAPVATSLTADFSTVLPRGSVSKSAKARRLALGKRSITLEAGGVARLEVKLPGRARKAIAGRRKVKIRMRVSTRELESGAKATTTRTLTFKVSR
jgi:YD repeat-containing protein